MKKKLGVFGGTFDPVHKGHVDCIFFILKRMKFDEILIVLNASPPHKDNLKITSWIHRKKMLKMAFTETARIQISDIECVNETPSFTYSTLRQLKKDYSEFEITFILGMDNLPLMHTWKEYRTLINENKFLLMRRGGYDLSYSDCPMLSNDEFEKLTQKTIETPLINLSSTKIRQMIQQNDRAVEKFIQSDIFDYILKNNLYQKP